jgi:hypothetical protein
MPVNYMYQPANHHCFIWTQNVVYYSSIPHSLACGSHLSSPCSPSPEHHIFPIRCRWCHPVSIVRLTSSPLQHWPCYSPETRLMVSSSTRQRHLGRGMGSELCFIRKHWRFSIFKRKNISNSCVCMDLYTRVKVFNSSPVQSKQSTTVSILSFF